MIVVHMGLKKAGSTSIQAFLKDNEKSLRALSVDYAHVGRRERAAHHNFAREIIKGLKKFDPEYGTLSGLTEYWRHAPGRTLVISSELLEEAEVEQIAVLRDILAQARKNEEFRIVLVLRELLDLMPSSYAQKVKFGVRVADFDSFFDERLQARRVNYFQTAKRWADVFGWHQLRVRLLDIKHLVNGDLIDDFMAVCDLDLASVQESIRRRPRISNTSPGWKTLEALRALFSAGDVSDLGYASGAKLKLKERKEIGKRAIKVGNELGWNDEKGYYLTRAQAQVCLEIFRSSIEALNECLPEPIPVPIDLESRGFRDREFLPDVGHIPTEELRSFYKGIGAARREWNVNDAPRIRPS
jgi:hypothetical protein